MWPGTTASRTDRGKSLKPEAKILVATEIASDAVMVKKLLHDEFDNIVVSTDADRAVQDFENYCPDVLVLAFNDLEKAERYYLGLYRLSTVIHTLPHRTLILCRKDDLRRVYGLCKKEYFDDYIQFWPIAYDAMRLHMAMHHALRQMPDTAAGAPSVTEIAAQARHMAELESQLDLYAIKGGQRMETASRSILQAEKAIGAALDSFSSNLSEGMHPNLVEVRDRAGFQREFDRLKSEQIEKNFEAVAAAVHPVRQWAGSLKEDLAHQIESARALKDLTECIRPAVLVVDDDEFQNNLIDKMLDEENLDIFFATSCAQAFSILHKRRPDIILMDVNLPDIDGINATRRIKSIARFSDIPVVMITGLSEKEIVLDSLKAGALDFVVKPLCKDILITKLHKFLSNATSSMSNEYV